MIRSLHHIFTTPVFLTIAGTFAVNSFLFGNWIARLPEIKAGLELSEGQLGLTLLGIPLGALTMNFFSGGLIQSRGAGFLTFWSTMAYCLCMLLPALAPSAYFLSGAFFLIGLGASLMNVAMNTVAASLEITHHTRIMATCHGFYSLGGMIGAASGSYFAGIGWALPWHMSVMVLVMVGVVFFWRPIMMGFPDGRSEGSTFSWPRKAVLGLAAMAFCIYIAEGSVADWSAIYLHEYLGGNLGAAGLGFAGFSLAMALGRFNGDWLIPRLGSKPIAQIGSLLAAAGFLLVVLTPSPGWAIVGFTLVGIGFSCIAPIVFGAATRVPGMSPGAGLASVTTFGLVGFLIAPPLIGLIAEQWSLQHGLALMILLALAVTWLGGKIT